MFVAPASLATTACCVFGGSTGRLVTRNRDHVGVGLGPPFRPVDRARRHGNALLLRGPIAGADQIGDEDEAEDVLLLDQFVDRGLGSLNGRGVIGGDELERVAVIPPSAFCMSKRAVTLCSAPTKFCDAGPVSDVTRPIKIGLPTRPPRRR